MIFRDEEGAVIVETDGESVVHVRAKPRTKSAEVMAALDVAWLTSGRPGPLARYVGIVMDLRDSGGPDCMAEPVAKIMRSLPVALLVRDECLPPATNRAVAHAMDGVVMAAFTDAEQAKEWVADRASLLRAQALHLCRAQEPGRQSRMPCAACADRRCDLAMKPDPLPSD